MSAVVSDWRKSLQQASFRGVPFFTKSAPSEHGRRTVVHEFPQRDFPSVEDRGRKGRSFTVEAYVLNPHAEFAKQHSLGSNYMVWRDNLIDALEMPGAGTLVHPYRGTINATLIAPARITESADEGGMARFSMTFLETSANAAPVVRPDTPALVNAAADAAAAKVVADFNKKFNTNGWADFVVNGAKDIVNGALDFVTSVANFTNTGALGDLMHAAQAISGGLATLMQTPKMLADGIQGQLYALAALVSTPLDAFNAMQSFFASFSVGSDSSSGAAATIVVPYVPLTTPSRIQQAINQTAVIDLVRRTAIVEAARASSLVAFASYAEAQAALTLMANALDAELMSNTLTPTGQYVPLDDDVYDALLDLRVAVVRDISTRGANLAKLTTVTLPSTMPSLVAAYRIYGDCTMEADIVARNHIRRPGFVPGGVALEVLA